MTFRVSPTWHRMVDLQVPITQDDSIFFVRPHEAIEEGTRPYELITKARWFECPECHRAMGTRHKLGCSIAYRQNHEGA